MGIGCNKLRRLVRRTRVGRAILTVLRALDPRSAEERGRRRSRYQEVAKQLAPGFGMFRTGHRMGDCPVLIPAAGEPGHIVQQAPILAAFRAAGFEPVVALFDDRSGTRMAYQASGVRCFVDFGDYDCRSDPRVADAWLSGLASTHDLLHHRWHDIDVGRYALSTMMRSHRLGRIYLSGAHRSQLRSHLIRALDHARAAERIVGRVEPQAGLFIDIGYTPHGPFFDACLNASARAYTWNVAHKDNSLIMRRYLPDDRLTHPSTLSADTWSALRSMPWTAGHWTTLRAEIEACYRDHSWYGEVGTQFGTKLMSRSEVLRTLGIGDDRPIAAIFSHVLWDGTFFWGKDLFSDYEEWFLESVRRAYENSEILWIIKVHPANRVKNHRDGIDEAPRERQVIASLGAVPDHVRILDEDTNVSTISLIGAVDYCLTVRGTVGIEAACWGKRVVTAGTGRYDGMGFTTDSKSRAAYLSQLDRIASLPPMSAQEIELARRYGYGVFVVRPLVLDSVNVTFRHDAKASLTADVAAGDPGRVGGSHDVSVIADWVRSGAIDLIGDPTRLIRQSEVSPP